MKNKQYKNVDQPMESGKDRKITGLIREVARLNRCISKLQKELENRKSYEWLQDEVDCLSDEKGKLEARLAAMERPVIHKTVTLKELSFDEEYQLVCKLKTEIKKSYERRLSNISKVFRALKAGYAVIDYPELMSIVDSEISEDEERWNN